MDIPSSIDGRLRAAWRTAAILCLLGIAALAIDLPVSQARSQIAAFAVHRQFWMLAELFGDGLGVLLIALCIFLVDAARRPCLPRLLACAYGAGMSANAIKLLVARSRPRALDLVACDSVFSSFHGLRLWPAADTDVSIWASAYHSFPSAHTATAVGLAVGLSWLYPRGRIAVAILAAGVALQRVVVGAHFLSDTLVGASVGFVVAALCLDRRGLGARFDRWEQKLRQSGHTKAGNATSEFLASTGGHWPRGAWGERDMKIHWLKHWVSNWFRSARCRVRYRPASRAAEDVDPAVAQTIQRVAPYTLTSPERIAALCQAVTYVAQHQIPGAVVECGVWRGGSMMAVAETLMCLGQSDRQLYLFDTFDGMTPPGDQDVDLSGKRASELLKKQDRHDPESVWCVSPLEEVRRNMQSTGYPAERIQFVPGRVEETLPRAAPDEIAILRLDTDWYESTRHELEHLFPRIVPGGVLIIDDYGHWDGARRAVDEYLRAHGVPILLHRIDYTGRIGVVFARPERSAA